MTSGMNETPITGEVTALTDEKNVLMQAVPDEEQDDESLEFAYALLAGSPLPAVVTEDEI